MQFSIDQTISVFWLSGRRQKGVSEMLIELCITELEDVAAELEEGGTQGVRSLGSHANLAPVTQESNHPYTDDANQSGRVRIPGMLIRCIVSISEGLGK